jgi:hypothetical protein
MGVRGQRHAPSAPYPGKDPVPIVQETGWTSGPVWTGAENLTHTGIRSEDRPARRHSLYRLRYPAHSKLYMLAVEDKHTQDLINCYSKPNWPGIKLSSACLLHDQITYPLWDKRAATSGPRQQEGWAAKWYRNVESVLRDKQWTGLWVTFFPPLARS